MKKIISLLLAIGMLLCLCACGGASKDSAAYEMAPMEPAAAPTAEEAVEMEMMLDASATYSVGSGGEASASDTETRSAFESEKIIYSCYAEIETLTFEETCEEVTRLIDRYGGFLESSTVSGKNHYYDSRRSAEYVIRIPRVHFEEVTGNLSTLGNVPYCSISAENITASYRDTESRLAAYRVEEERLLAMLEKAETVADMLDIESRLSQVRYEIESLTTTILGWDSLVNYSTVTLYVEEVIEYTETEELGYWERMGKDFMENLRDVGEFFKDLFRGIISSLPVLAVLAVAAGIVVAVIRGLRKRRTKKRSERKENRE